jgi:hypothetical protein
LLDRLLGAIHRHEAAGAAIRDVDAFARKMIESGAARSMTIKCNSA